MHVGGTKNVSGTAFGSGRFARAAGACAFGLALLLAALAGGCGEGGGSTEVTKVVVLGVDGLDWRLLDPLLEEGRLPNIAALIERGTRAELRSLEPEMKSPMIWTTIATGKGPQKHGIADFLAGGEKRPLYNSNGWMARPVWDILSERDYTVGVINWLVSWPAKPVNGYNVSDRILYRPEDGFAEIERVTYPVELDDELASHIRPISDVNEDDLAPLLNGEQWRTDPTPALTDAVTVLRDLYGNDETVRTTATYLLESREQPDFFAVYVNGADVASHFFWGPMDPSSLDVQIEPEVVETCSDVIPNYYERIDALLGEILELVDDDSTIILCSDHGFRGPWRSPNGLKLGIWMHRVIGVLVAAGPGVREGGVVDDASVFDITPTILALMGEPVAYDMDGFVLDGLISEERLREAPVEYIETYEGSSYAGGTGERNEPVESAVDDEIRERLESLGYIE